MVGFYSRLARHYDRRERSDGLRLPGFFLTHMILISIPELLTILLLAALVPFLGLIVYDFHRKNHHADQDTTKRD